MPSQIDETKPIEGAPTTASVRANFSTAKVEISTLQDVTAGGPFLPLAGGRLTGPMYLWNDPTDGRMPATKDYVDTHGVGGGGGIPEAPADGATYGRQNGAWIPALPLAGGVLTGTLDVGGNGVTYSAWPGHRIGFEWTGTAMRMRVDGADSGLIPSGDQYLPLAGGAMTGLLTLSAAPTADLHAATKLYVDTGLAAKAPLASPLFSGTPTAPTAPVGTTTAQLATCGFVRNGFLPLTGGTLTGALGVTGNVSTTGGGFVSAGKSIAFADASYNYIYDNGGFASITLGRATGDNNNYHKMQSHWFQSAGASPVNYCQFANSFCYNGDGFWHAFSERDLKQDIEPYTRGLAAILALNPVRFRYKPGAPFAPKDAASDQHIGLIVEDVLPQFPELTGEHTFRSDIGEPDQTRATFAPGGLVFALINAVRELDARLTAMEPPP